MERETKFEGWAILELFGHQRIAGLVGTQEIGGAAFVRVDVPEVDGQAAFTKFYGAAAIYAITPVSEEVARLAAASLAVRPVNVWIPTPERQLSPPDVDDEMDEYDEYEDDEPWRGNTTKAGDDEPPF